MKPSKTSRILSVFHLFRFCEEVSYQEVTDLMPVSEKTIYRDICLLKQAGVVFPRFFKKQNAFIRPFDDLPPPAFPTNKSQKLYLEKIIRLCTMMLQMDQSENPVVWYAEQYPSLSARTRQRDFAELAKIGYLVAFDREGCNGKPNHYYCDFPYNTYGLLTFI